jgi:hypothetical protein
MNSPLKAQITAAVSDTAYVLSLGRRMYASSAIARAMPNSADPTRNDIGDLSYMSSPMNGPTREKPKTNTDATIPWPKTIRQLKTMQMLIIGASI